MNSKSFKRAVRARMEKTGESYTRAMHALREGGSVEPKVVVISVPVPEGGDEK